MNTARQVNFREATSGAFSVGTDRKVLLVPFPTDTWKRGLLSEDKHQSELCGRCRLVCSLWRLQSPGPVPGPYMMLNKRWLKEGNSDRGVNCTAGRWVIVKVRGTGGGKTKAKSREI